MFTVAFVLVWAAMALWSLATPLFAGPDEPVQVIKAVAVDHGQLLGKLDTAPGQHEFAEVHVAGFYSVDRSIPQCYDHKPLVAASCARLPAVNCHHAPSSTAPPCGIAFIYNARYPPLYYALVGLPSLLPPGDLVVYLMRLLSGAISAVFLALSFTAALCWSRRRGLLCGILVAATPMVIYLGGVVNPSSLETSAALCAWTTGAILVLERGGGAPRALVVSIVVSACAFEASRPISPFWLALVALVLVGVAEADLLRGLLRQRGAQVGLGIVAAVGIVACIWILKEHATDILSSSSLPASTPEITILEQSLRHTDYYLPTMVGVFGTFDTFAPTFTYVVWYGLLGFVGIAAAVVTTRRRTAVLGLLAAAIVVVPVAISSSQAYRYGYTWNGRDTLPLAVGLPVVAAALIGQWWEQRLAASPAAQRGAPPAASGAGGGAEGAEGAEGSEAAGESFAAEVAEARSVPAARAASGKVNASLRGRPSSERLTGAVVLLAGLAQLAAFEEALRRYAVGTGGPDFGFLLHSSWDAPGGNATLVVAEGVVLLVAGLLATRASRRGWHQDGPLGGGAPADRLPAAGAQADRLPAAGA